MRLPSIDENAFLNLVNTLVMTFLVSNFTCRRLLGHAESVANHTVQTSHLIMHLPRLFLSLELRDSLHDSVLFIILRMRTKLIVTVWCYCTFGTYTFQTITPLDLLENVLLILVDHLTLSSENFLCARVEVGLILFALMTFLTVLD